jgi:hypothetical protein
MSRLRIFSFFGDCAIQDYRGPTFDRNDTDLDLSQEPVKQTSEIKVDSLNEAIASLKAASNRERTPCFGLFESEKLKIGFHCAGPLSAMSFYSGDSGFYQCDFTKLLAAIKSAPKSLAGKVTVRLLFGSDQIIESKVNSLEEAEEYFRELQHLFAECCHDTSVIPILSAIAEIDGASWIATCDHQRFIPINRSLEDAVSYLKNRKSSLN